MAIIERITIGSFGSVMDVIELAKQCSQMIMTGQAEEAQKKLQEFRVSPMKYPIVLFAQSDLSKIFLHVQVEDEMDHSLETVHLLKEIPLLTSLSLRGNGIPDLKWFSELIKLKELTLFQENARHYEALSQMRKLESLRIYGSDMSQWEFLLDLPQLHSLYLSLSSCVDYSWVQQMKQLDFLALSGCKNGLEPVSELTQLKHLFFNSLLDYDVELSPLESLHELRSLEIHGDTCIDLQPISKLKQLERLVIYTNSVTSKQALADLPNLSQCYIGLAGQ